MFALVLILITTVAIISEVQFSVITKNVNIPGKKTKKGFKLKIIKMIIDGMCIKINALTIRRKAMKPTRQIVP
jgi:hypothetical protein